MSSPSTACTLCGVPVIDPIIAPIYSTRPESMPLPDGVEGTRVYGETHRLLRREPWCVPCATAKVNEGSGPIIWLERRHE